MTLAEIGRQVEPIELATKQGVFLCKNIYKGHTLLFDEVCGRLVRIWCASLNCIRGTFPYWHIQLQDTNNGNAYILLYPYTSSLFCSIMLRLANASAGSLNNVSIQPYTEAQHPNEWRAWYRNLARVYADGVELQEVEPMPPIRRYKFCDKKRKDYTPRLSRINELIQRVNARIGDRGHGDIVP